MKNQTLIFFVLAVFLAVCQAQNNCQARYGNSCYYFSRYVATRDNAEKACQKMGGHLVTIETQGEQRFLHREVRARNKWHYWIGLEALRNRYWEQQDWRWQERGNYLRRYVANWAKNEPDDRDGIQSCVIYAQDLGYQWDDYDCFARANFICEIPMAVARRG